MVLWQAIALAGGLSMVGAPIVYGLSPFGASLPQAIPRAYEVAVTEDYAGLAHQGVHLTHLFALCFGVLLGAHLLLTLARTYLKVLSARRRHRQLVSLLSTPLDDDSSTADGELTDTHIIEHNAPLAYCLPGRTNASSVTVLSRGLLEQLTEAELAAVVAHEKTHLRQRHHLLTMAFEAWYRALPWLPTTRFGREAVLELTEMLADDGALAEHSHDDLLRSIATTTPGEGQEQGPAHSPGHTPDGKGGLITGARLQRLLIPQATVPRSLHISIALGVIALLGVPTTLLVIS